MNVRREKVSANGWFPEGVEIVPDLAVPLIVAAVLLIAVAAVAGVFSLGRRR